MSEVSVKIYIYLLLFALPTKLVILAAKKIRLFWWSVFDRSLLSAFFFFPHSITIQILVNWLFNNLFQNISGNWSLADCCEIPWVLLFLLKKKKEWQGMRWLTEKWNYSWSSVCASCSLALFFFNYFFSYPGNATAFMKQNNCLKTCSFCLMLICFGPTPEEFLNGGTE